MRAAALALPGPGIAAKRNRGVGTRETDAVVVRDKQREKGLGYIGGGFLSLGPALAYRGLAIGVCLLGHGSYRPLCTEGAWTWA